MTLQHIDQVSSVLYRLFTKVIGNRVQQWIEQEGILGEKQNGFRSGRRGEDNLFILTSAIEISRRQNQGLICAFLDCSCIRPCKQRSPLGDPRYPGHG